MWRLTAGVLAGTGATVAGYSAIALYMAVSDSANAILDTAAVMVWAAASVGVGLLAGRIAGRLEFPVAVGSGVLGLISSGGMPGSFMDPVVLIFSGIFFVALVAVGSLVAWSTRPGGPPASLHSPGAQVNDPEDS